MVARANTQPTHMSVRGCLVVRVEEARDLANPQKWLGSLRPAVRVTLGDQRRTTNTSGGMNGHAPAFGEEFVFPLQKRMAPATREELLVHAFTHGAGGEPRAGLNSGAFIGSGGPIPLSAPREPDCFF